MESRTDFFIEVLNELPAVAAQTLEEGTTLIEEES
jgi:hypothetical protein